MKSYLIVAHYVTCMGIEVSLQKNGSNGRYNLTIPKSIVESKEWEKGDEFEIVDIGGGELRVKRK